MINSQIIEALKQSPWIPEIYCNEDLQALLGINSNQANTIIVSINGSFYLNEVLFETTNFGWVTHHDLIKQLSHILSMLLLFYQDN